MIPGSYDEFSQQKNPGFQLLLPGCVPSLAELGFSSEELAEAEGCREKSAIPWRGGERSSGEFPPVSSGGLEAVWEVGCNLDSDFFA